MGKIKEILIPGCRRDAKTGALYCETKLISDGKVYKAERPIVIVPTGDTWHIHDDGSAPSFLIEKLIKHLEKHGI